MTLTGKPYASARGAYVLAGVLAVTLATAPSGAAAKEQLVATTPAPTPPDAPQPAAATPNESGPIKTGVPAGFESDASIQTVFDVSFQGASVGSFGGRLANGVFRFDNPQAVAVALGAHVNPAEAISLLSQSLHSNEALRCLENQKENCDLLPAGTSGVIVNPERFTVTLFLGREFLVESKQGPDVLAEPISGPSLIQGVMLTASADALHGAQTHVGGTFNTNASLGRSALTAQISGDDTTGFQLQQGYVQRVQNNWLASAGLLTSQNQTTLTTLRYFGVDVSSYQTSTVNNPNQGTPLDVLLPRRARVELYANGTLVSVKEYDGGLQLLDTGALPTGSYNVGIVARDGSTVIYDQTRPFTRAGGLPPAGRFVFDVSAGERVGDFFTSPTGSSVLNGGSATTSFIPHTTGELILRGQVAHRIGSASALTADVTLVGSNVYPELTFQTYHGRFSGLLGASADTHGDFSVLLNGTALVNKVSFSLSARYTDANAAIAAATTATLANQLRYLPYSQTGESIYTSSTFPLFHGTLSLTVGYDHQAATPAIPDTYTYGLEYDRPIKDTFFGTSAQFSFFASASDQEKLVGFKFSFFRTIDAHTGLNYEVGAEYAKGTDPTSVKTGGAPVVDVSLDHNQTVGPVDTNATITASTTDSQQHSLQAQAQASSPWGTAQITAAYQNNLVGNSNSAPVTLDLQSGFVIGGSQIKFGIPTPGQAMILAVIDRPPREAPKVDVGPAPASTVPASSAASTSETSAGSTVVSAGPAVAAGSYRVVINNQPYGLVNVGRSSAIAVQPYKDYSVTLQAVGAPPYDFDLTTREVPVYPGNVVVLHWKARHVTTIFGRLVDEAGRPLPKAQVNAGTDTTVTDDKGYFVITGPVDGDLSMRDAAGSACRPIVLRTLPGVTTHDALLKVGDVVCRAK